MVSKHDIALSHSLPGCSGPYSRLQGFLALASVWIFAFFLGPLTPVIVWALVRHGYPVIAVALFTVVACPFIFSPGFLGLARLPRSTGRTLLSLC